MVRLSERHLRKYSGRRCLPDATALRWTRRYGTLSRLLPRLMFRRFTDFLVHWWQRWAPGQRWKARMSPEEPKTMDPRIVYVVGETEPWAAVFVCPSGCQQLVWLNLLEGHRSRWRIHVSHRGVRTVTPSVNR